MKILQTYSPLLNIVEQAVRCLKTNIKADQARPHVQIDLRDRNAAKNAPMSLDEHCKQLLVAVAKINLQCLTMVKCTVWFRYTQTYLPACLSKDFIQG